MVLRIAGINFVSSKWSDIVDWLLPMARKHNVKIIVGRLVIASSSYFIWQERNNRVHGKGSRRPEELSKIVANHVRLKLASIKFKKNVRVEQMRRTWRLPSLLSEVG